MRRSANEESDVNALNAARSELRRKLNEAKDAARAPEAAPSVEEKQSSRPVKPGDMVQVKSLGVKAEVISVSPERVLSLRAGIMALSAKEDEVLLLEGEKPKQKVVSGGGTALRTSALSSEIDLRGMEAMEAVLVTERYLDSAVMAKLSTVRIIHGKGTGALRTAIQQMLRKNKAVKSFRLGRYGEGETGVTVVELK